MTKARVWTQEEIEEMREVFRYDTESPSCLSRLKGGQWVHVKGGDTGSGHKQVSYRGRRVLIHRVLFMMYNGPLPSDSQIDHIDGNPSNNVLSNLRLTTSSENQQNTGKSGRNTSGVPNVSWHKASSKWRVDVSCNGRIHSGGRFTDLESARVAAEALSRKLKGSYYREGLHDKDEVRTDPTTLS